MHARNNGYSYSGCDDYVEEDEFDNNDKYIALNYNDFLDHANKSYLSPPLDESEYENYDLDERDCRGQGNYEQQYFTPHSSGKSVAGGQHSCLKLKNDYCYLDRNAYDTRVMRNLTPTDYELPCGSYSPRFIQAALDRTKSSTSWSDGLSKKSP
ncbi:uncharacterized protein LOC124411095 [Diprion similis]|uniref:uncharacterized protein LOC124411095 n=1 Tax=Diprion similis TaxID=362088 RepID=UPI001EF937C0|nr:uncharacterized protein LOC124411095 [Diprion similis]